MSWNVYGNVFGPGVSGGGGAPSVGEDAPVNQCGGLRTLIIGDAYVDERAFVWSTPKPENMDVSTATTTFRGWKREYEWSTDGTITEDTDSNGDTIWILSFVLTSAETSALEEGNYGWSVSLAQSSVTKTVVHWKEHQLATWILNEASSWR